MSQDAASAAAPLLPRDEGNGGNALEPSRARQAAQPVEAVSHSSESSTAARGGGRAPSTAAAYGVLFLLLVVYIHNQWTRSLIYYVVDFSDLAESAPDADVVLMNEAVGFSAATYGAMASLAFTAVFAPVSLLAGTAADRCDRSLITWLSLLGWSAATAWQGFATSVWEVIGSRAVQGLAQAFTTPAAYTLLADVTPASRRGAVNSIYACGVYIGAGASALSILLDRRYGWRMTLWIAGGAGGALALLSMAALRDRLGGQKGCRCACPAPRLAPGQASSFSASFARTLCVIAARPAVALLFVSSVLRFSAGLSVAVWVAPWARLSYPQRQESFALAKAFISIVGGSVSAVCGGALSDRLSRTRGGEGERLWVPLVGLSLAAVFWVLALTSSTFERAMSFLLLQFLAAECWFGPTVAVMQYQLPVDVQGGAQGVFSTLMVAGNAAPVAIGALQRTWPLPVVLRAVVPALYAGSALCFALTLGLQRRAEWRARAAVRPMHAPSSGVASEAHSAPIPADRAAAAEHSRHRHALESVGRQPTL